MYVRYTLLTEIPWVTNCSQDNGYEVDGVKICLIKHMHSNIIIIYVSSFIENVFLII